MTPYDLNERSDFRVGSRPQGRPSAPEDRWPAPALWVLEPPRAEPPLFPCQEIFGQQWSAWIEAAAAAKCAPADYVAGALLAVASSLIANALWAAPTRDWTTPPVLWVMLIGEPSSGKSPGLSAVIGPLSVIESRQNAAFEASYADWAKQADIARIAKGVWEEQAKKAIKKGEPAPAQPNSVQPPSEPTPTRLVINDATVERLTTVLSRQPRGTLMYRDELSGWLLNFTRYANGGSDREFWLESCEGRTYVSERQGRGSTRIERFSVAITGGIQPDKLRNGLLKAGDDGLLARFLPIWPHPAPLHRDPPLLDNRLAESAFERLLGIEMATDDKGRATPNLVQFTEAARDSHFNWCASIREREADGLLKSFIGKTPGFVARIALVLAALDWALTTDAARPRIVTREHIDRARTYVATYLIPMAERSYAEASISPDIRNANKIAHFIKSEQPASISIRDVQRKKWSGMLQVHEIEKAFNVLIECDWLRERKTQTAGRPRREFQVNPILLRRSDLNRTGC